MAKPSRKKQQTLEATLGRPRIKPAVITPRKATPTKASPSKNSVIAMHPPAAASSSSPGGNFMTSSQVIVPSARKLRSTRPSVAYLEELDTSSATEDGEDESPVRSTRQKPKGKEKAIVISDDDDEEEEEDELPTKRGKSSGSKPASISSSSESPSPAKKSTPKRKQPVQLDDDEDEDDIPIVTPVSLRFNRKRRMAVDSDDSDDQPLVSSPVKKRRLIRKGSSSPAKPQQDDSEDEVVAPTPKLRSSQTPRKALSAKEKAREMLRRRRAGETIIEEDEEDEEEDEEEVEPRKALYDTDSDHLALSEFEDEEEEEEEEEEDAQPSEAHGKKKKESKRDKKDKMKKQKLLKHLKPESDDEGTEAEAEDLDDFVVEDDSDEPLGAPDELMMPLQFTHHARKKLIEHFRDVVEWLVQYKINPGFAEKTDELYCIGWQKLDDEVRALASSKFTSSVWKPDFYKSLRARPQYTSIEVGANNHDSVFGSNCEACGRSGHPATWTISFSGTPYVKKFGMNFLDPVEPPSSSDDSSSSASSSSTGDIDEDGNTIPPEDKTFYVGVTCNGNAEIAHTLIHWKHALQDWVESQLMAEGWMQPAKLAEREGMKPRRKYKLVDKIVEGWVADGKVRALFGEFQGQLERARNQQTSSRGYRRG
ncbi:hypothetical protein QBC40DRAFT_192067 [Triangularia verruculosa]|uniref:DUF4211 domain-containing protein n=1 Tax=Triangularia verruculosa TaxID=2587418 RepID=A0AAN6XS52_9PEZI|nr:hypothetical protein QBC40DRAFT_192067 [Triangularia verruculosa]